MRELIRSINPKATKSQELKRIRVATYNVHKCCGLDGRVRPDRILGVLNEIDADIVALQEVVCVEGQTRQDHQARYLAHELEAHVEFGENRRHKGGGYGNVLLSRFPIHHAHNYDLSVPGRERRGCLRADLCLRDGEWLHIFNLHLGTSFFERREQARKLFRQEILTDGHLPGQKIVLGDFNEWTKGLASRLFQSHFRTALSGTPRGTQTYPGLLPMLHLDHIYFDRDLELRSATVHRSRTALLASDHLPLVAEFAVANEPSRPVLEPAPLDTLAFF
jgi:endonuclease/exonuclease/phosphatase family metal-dependent hydrolase